MVEPDNEVELGGTTVTCAPAGYRGDDGKFVCAEGIVVIK